MRPLFLIVVLLATVFFASMHSSNAIEKQPTTFIGKSSLGQELFEGTFRILDPKLQDTSVYSFYQIYDPQVTFEIRFKPQLYGLLQKGDSISPQPRGVRSLRRTLADYRQLHHKVSGVQALRVPLFKRMPHIRFEIDATGATPFLVSALVNVSDEESFQVPLSLGRKWSLEGALALVLDSWFLLKDPERLQGRFTMYRGILAHSDRVEFFKKALRLSDFEAIELSGRFMHSVPLSTGVVAKLGRSFSIDKQKEFHSKVEEKYTQYLILHWMAKEKDLELQLGQPSCLDALK